MDRTTQARGHETSLNRSAVQATLHCLTGCAIGEVLGMVIATALGWGNAGSIGISVALALSSATCSRLARSCARAYPYAARPPHGRLRHGLNHNDGTRRQRFHPDRPGAIAAGLADRLFWWSLAASLASRS